jgi:hypothetical protein
MSVCECGSRVGTMERLTAEAVSKNSKVERSVSAANKCARVINEKVAIKWFYVNA